MEVEAAIEAIGDGSEVAFGGLTEAEGIGLAGSDPKHTTIRTTTTRAAEALWPAGLLQCGRALRLGTKPLGQLKQG